MNKKRILLVACSVITLCVCIIAGMSYALFTDSVSVGNHLQAGNLKVTLARTKLEYSVLNEQGELAVTTNNERLDFTEKNENNVFGIDSTDIRIVPGSYFDAELEISNGGNTAFDYNVGIKLVNESTALAEQLKVTVRDGNGDVIDTKMLSELAGGLTIDAGHMKANADAQTFSVRVEFVDDVVYNNGLTPETNAEGETLEVETMDNDEAQSGTAVFDLVVTAVQATATAAD